jgi:hypothetical protein
MNGLLVLDAVGGDAAETGIVAKFPNIVAISSMLKTTRRNCNRVLLILTYVLSTVVRFGSAASRTHHVAPSAVPHSREINSCRVATYGIKSVSVAHPRFEWRRGEMRRKRRPLPILLPEKHAPGSNLHVSADDGSFRASPGVKDWLETDYGYASLRTKLRSNGCVFW